MIELSNTIYIWIKAFHIIAVITWMAGLLYLPRLFVYHCDAEVGSQQSETFKIMERRLLKGIINPSMILAFLFGGILLLNLPGETLSEGWLQTKLLLIILLTSQHIMMARWRRDFEADINNRTARFYRWMNEVPAFLMIGIVICAVVRPF